VISLPNDELKFGFVVSKKVGNAVVRNKLKRRFRAIAREAKLRSGWHIFLAKPATKDFGFQQLQKDALRCLSRL